MSKAFFILSIMLLLLSSLMAQEKTYILNIEPALPINIKNIKLEHKDTLKLFNELNFIESRLRVGGYSDFKRIEDTLIENTRIIKYDYGKIWYWGKIKLSENLQLLFPKSELKKMMVENNIIRADLVEEVFEKIISYAEEHGYPFAEIKFDSVERVAQKINASVVLILHEMVKFDTLNIIDKSAIHSSFLSSYIGIKAGDVYNEKKILSIQNRVDELGFIRLKFPPKIYFANNVATLVLSPEKRNANRFDGLIGVQPTGTSAKTSIVGQAQLYLVNLLGRGEKASIDFRSQANETRDLKLMLNYPFVFSTSFGLTGNLDIRRQDTSFSILGRAIGVQYLFTGNNQLSLIYKISESNLLSTKKYENATVLPENIDVKRNSYGISTQFEKLDYRINPKEGYFFQSSILFGTRKITKNAGLKDTLYSGLDLSSTQVQLAVHFKKFFKLSDRNVLMSSFKTEWIESEKVFNNEMARIGGINDLRGFDEESIFTSYYWIGTLEYRFILDRNSFFRIFFDKAYYQNKALNVEDYPYGIGSGVQIQTVAGMLQLSYALGVQNNSNLNFQTGKIHFGIINYF